jgi:FkbM family methyltransferase
MRAARVFEIFEDSMRSKTVRDENEKFKRIPWQRLLRNKMQAPLPAVVVLVCGCLLAIPAAFEALPSLHQHSVLQKLCPGHSGCNSFHSQAGQDRYVWNRFFRWSADTGVFVEFGARDGIQHSNTAFFELSLQWKGLLIEPFENRSTVLKNRPGSQVIHGLVHDKGGLTLQYSGNDGEKNTGTSKYNETVDLKAPSFKFTVTSYRLKDLLMQSNLRHIDYMCVDTEGTEFEILSGFEADEFEIDVIQVESPPLRDGNSSSSSERERERERALAKTNLVQVMAQKGYDLDHEFWFGATSDLIFRRRAWTTRHPLAHNVFQASVRVLVFLCIGAGVSWRASVFSHVHIGAGG